ncbi:uncharacterized protein DMAD_05383 [Drosophila madeirensis]|uniref:Uncharacterized protein n=1 Tax=Drosophila madeirensis TaxID=30013 RepID=A0AAU9FLM5_DROMD
MENTQCQLAQYDVMLSAIRNFWLDDQEVLIKSQFPNSIGVCSQGIRIDNELIHFFQAAKFLGIDDPATIIGPYSIGTLSAASGNRMPSTPICRPAHTVARI